MTMQVSRELVPETIQAFIVASTQRVARVTPVGYTNHPKDMVYIYIYFEADVARPDLVYVRGGIK